MTTLSFLIYHYSDNYALKRTLSSIQETPDVSEVIIIGPKRKQNDIENTLSLSSDLNVKLFFCDLEKNNLASLSEVIQLTQGQFISILSSGDTFLEDTFSILSRMNKEHDADMTFCNVGHKFPSCLSCQEPSTSFITQILNMNHFNYMGKLYKRSFLEECVQTYMQKKQVERKYLQWVTVLTASKILYINYKDGFEPNLNNTNPSRSLQLISTLKLFLLSSGNYEEYEYFYFDMMIDELIFLLRNLPEEEGESFFEEAKLLFSSISFKYLYKKLKKKKVNRRLRTAIFSLFLNDSPLFHNVIFRNKRLKLHKYIALVIRCSLDKRNKIS